MNDKVKKDSLFFTSIGVIKKKNNHNKMPQKTEP